MEGFAYLTARIQTKFDAEFPRLTQSLLESVFPHYLAPTPSMLIAGFEPEPTEAGLVGGYPIPRGTLLRGNLGRGASVPAQFRTAHDVTLWPLRIKEAVYTTREIGAFELPNHLRPKAVVRLRFEITAAVPAKDLRLNDLDIYLRGGNDLPFRLHEQILAHGGKSCFSRAWASSGARWWSTARACVRWAFPSRNHCCRWPRDRSKGIACCESISFSRSVFCFSSCSA